METFEYFDVKGIPVGIVDDHNGVLLYWNNSKIKNATLFRVDAHPDMVDYSLFRGELRYDYFNPSNFNCPAVYHRVIDSIYWHNPHSIERNLQDLGTVKEKEGRRKIGVSLERCLSPNPKDNGPLYVWKYNKYLQGDIAWGMGKKISPEEIMVDGPLIVDFDLDGFCCIKTATCTISFKPKPDYDSESNFEKRIDESIEILKQLPWPKLITIARSLGNEYGGDRCVPRGKVDKVQEYLIERLKEIY